MGSIPLKLVTWMKGRKLYMRGTASGKRRMLDDLLVYVARHVEIELSLQEYVALLEPFRTFAGIDRLPYRDDEDARRFWKYVPTCTIARCPLCGIAYTEQVNIYNMRNVWTLGNKPRIFQHQSFCEHFVGAQGFIHLNGVIPNHPYRGGSEVPYVMPIFLPDDPESYAVMHCLPVCRAEGNVFVSRYLLFTVTYYSQSPRTLQQKRDEERFEPDMKPLPRMYSWREVDGVNQEAWDLVRWVSEGKLWWLDLDRDDLPLRSGPAAAFPYANIEGIRKGFANVKGELEVDLY